MQGSWAVGIWQAGAPGLGVLESVLVSKVLGRLEGSISGSIREHSLKK